MEIFYFVGGMFIGAFTTWAIAIRPIRKLRDFDTWKEWKNTGIIK
jgi:hypothetical protein